MSTARFQATTLTIRQLRVAIVEAEYMASQTTGAERAHWIALAAIYSGELNVRMVELRKELDELHKDMLLIRTSEGNLWHFQPEYLEQVTLLALADLENDAHVWWHDGSENWYEYEEVLDEEGDRIWNDQGQYLATKILFTETDDGITQEVIGQVWREPNR